MKKREDIHILADKNSTYVIGRYRDHNVQSIYFDFLEGVNNWLIISGNGIKHEFPIPDNKWDVTNTYTCLPDSPKHSIIWRVETKEIVDGQTIRHDGIFTFKVQESLDFDADTPIEEIPPAYMNEFLLMQASRKNLEDAKANGELNGPAGPDGLSAYEVAVKNGFVGTEQEWLDSLVGGGSGTGTSDYNKLFNKPTINGIEVKGNITTEQLGIRNGVDGQPGKDGYTPIKGVDYFDGATGPQGPQGEPGRDGADGQTGPIGPQGPVGKDGAIGPQGPEGKQGPQGLPGADGKPGKDGVDGKQGPVGPAGTTVYSELTDKPQINGVELSGNKTLEELGFVSGGAGGPLKPLTFTGASTGVYDGTKPLTVDIPAGGSGGKNGWAFIKEVHIESTYAGTLKLELSTFPYSELMLVSELIPKINGKSLFYGLGNVTRISYGIGADTSYSYCYLQKVDSKYYGYATLGTGWGTTAVELIRGLMNTPRDVSDLTSLHISVQPFDSPDIATKIKFKVYGR